MPSSLYRLRVTVETEIFTVAVAALDRIGSRIERMQREVVAVVDEGEERVAVLVTIDAERVTVAILAGHRIGAGYGTVNALPSHLVVLR